MWRGSISHAHFYLKKCLLYNMPLESLGGWGRPFTIIWQQAICSQTLHMFPATPSTGLDPGCYLTLSHTLFCKSFFPMYRSTLALTLQAKPGIPPSLRFHPLPLLSVLHPSLISSLSHPQLLVLEVMKAW